MGSKSKSSSSNSTATTNTDKRLVVESGIGVSTDNTLKIGNTRGNLSLVQTDQGAVTAALDAIRDTTSKAMDAVSNAGAAAGAASSKAAAAAMESGNKTTKAAFDLIQANDATNGKGFQALLGVADKLFSTGADVLQQSQTAAMGNIAAINTAANDARGAIDQKTIMVVAGIAGAAFIANAMRK